MSGGLGLLGDRIGRRNDAATLKSTRRPAHLWQAAQPGHVDLQYSCSGSLGDCQIAFLCWGVRIFRRRFQAGVLRGGGSEEEASALSSELVGGIPLAVSLSTASRAQEARHTDEARAAA